MLALSIKLQLILLVYRVKVKITRHLTVVLNKCSVQIATEHVYAASLKHSDGYRVYVK